MSASIQERLRGALRAWYNTEISDADVSLMIGEATALIDALQAERNALAAALIPRTHEAADAFWKYWRENGETHKHGYYESTWGAISAALKASGTPHADGARHEI